MVVKEGNLVETQDTIIQVFKAALRNHGIL